MNGGTAIWMRALFYAGVVGLVTYLFFREDFHVGDFRARGTYFILAMWVIFIPGTIVIARLLSRSSMYVIVFALAGWVGVNVLYALASRGMLEYLGVYSRPGATVTMFFSALLAEGVAGLILRRFKPCMVHSDAT